LIEFRLAQFQFRGWVARKTKNIMSVWIELASDLDCDRITFLSWGIFLVPIWDARLQIPVLLVVVSHFAAAYARSRDRSHLHFEAFRHIL